MMKFRIMTLSFALILAMQPTAQANGNGSGVGAIIGAVGGGLIGSTIGKGDGKLVATATGAVLGAMIMQEILAQNQSHDPVVRPRSLRWQEPRKKGPNKAHRPLVRYGDDVLVCPRSSNHCHWVR